MEAGGANGCANCQRLQAQVEALQAELAQLRQQVAALGKDSSTSSKPPSSDIVKPPKPAPPPGQDRRKPGAQPGHPKHERAAFTAEQLNGGTHQHTLDCCPDCGHATQPVDGPPRAVQQVDVRLIPVVIEEHQGHPAFCPRCLKLHYAPLPAHVEAGGLVGPGLTALVAYLKGFCHASFSTIRTFLKDVAGVPISRGQLAKVIAKVSCALQAPYDELLAALPAEPRLNVDETGHKDGGDLLWTWCFRAELYTLFKIDPRRSADVLIEVLGREFDGVLGCDHFSAYRRYMRECSVAVQFCLAHLIREVKFLTTLPALEDVIYGTRLLVALEGLFGVIHRREQLPAEEFDLKLRQARELVLRVGSQDAGTQHSRRMAKRLRKYGAAYFTFITTPGLEPTNNLAEQAIRFVVIDRLITQGTRSEAGQRFCERIWTVMASCAGQGRGVFDYLREAVRAHFAGEEAPSLLPVAP
jgi:transposase